MREPRVGRVALVGAGPGDPALLTLRAAELLRTADVVAHDELVSESILAMVPARAELVSVGRRAGHGHTDYRLHPLVLERAREGKTVGSSRPSSRSGTYTGRYSRTRARQ